MKINVRMSSITVWVFYMPQLHCHQALQSTQNHAAYSSNDIEVYYVVLFSIFDSNSYLVQKSTRYKFLLMESSVRKLVNGSVSQKRKIPFTCEN